MDLEHALGLDPGRLTADADRFFAELTRPRDDAEPVRAESGDGLVAVEYSCAAGVRDLRLDPRALRMESARLARTILDLLHQAREQAERRERERAEADLGAGNALLADRALIAGRLRDATGDRVRALLRD